MFPAAPMAMIFRARFSAPSARRMVLFRFVVSYSRTIMDEYKIGTKGEARSTALTMKDLLGRDGWSTFSRVKATSAT